MRRSSRNPSQNLKLSPWRRVIAAAGGLGTGVPRHKGPFVGFIACNLTPTYAVVVLMVVKLCKSPRYRGTEPCDAAVDWSCDLPPEIEQVVFRGSINPNLSQD